MLDKEQIKQNLLADKTISEKDKNDPSIIWQIFDENINLIEDVKGRYYDVIEYALSFFAFYGNGHGGTISKKEEKVRIIPRGYSFETAKALYLKKENLLKELSEIEEKLKYLDIDYE